MQLLQSEHFLSSANICLPFHGWLLLTTYVASGVTRAPLLCVCFLVFTQEEAQRPHVALHAQSYLLFSDVQVALNGN